MGSGKTTAGRMLAEKLQYGFADLDELIEEHDKLPITEIFAGKGEKYFRNAETRVLGSLLDNQNTVVACGGGTPCFHDNMEKMKSAGITLYFKTSPSLLARRLSAAGTSRPLIAGMQGSDLRNHIRRLLAGREGWYRQADIIYDADNFQLEELLGIVANRIKSLE